MRLELQFDLDKPEINLDYRRLHFILAEGWLNQM